jgi:hypothetical protein
MNPARLVVALLALAACSDLSGDSDVPIALEIRAPAGVGGSNPVVEIGDTFQLNARALNQDGDSVAAVFIWRTLDTALLFVDPTTGNISGKKVGTPARIQVASGNLTSDLVSFSVVPAAESLLIISPDTVHVLSTDPQSVALITELDTLNPTGPLSGRQIVYLIASIWGVGASATLNGGFDTIVVVTGTDGRPSTNVVVVPGTIRPDSMIVEVRAYRPSSFSRPTPVFIPGSGQQFIVKFDP